MSRITQFGQYLLLKKLATGGMAELFLGKQVGIEGFEKPVVIKRILPHLTENEDFITMFLDEARVAARLNHPRLVQIYDLGKEDEAYYIAMEYIRGQDLRKIIKRTQSLRESMPIGLAVQVMIGVLEGLDHAHRQTDDAGSPLHLVHRDVSPQNILVSYQGDVKLVDFGIAKASTQIYQTRVGILKGKYAYMSPEQAQGRTVDRRSDVFAAGIVLYEITTGRRLFRQSSEVETLKKVIEGSVDPPSSIDPLYPSELEAIVMKALHRDSNARYDSAREMQVAIDNFTQKQGIIGSTQRLSEFMQRIFAAEIEKDVEEMRVLMEARSGSSVGGIELPPPPPQDPPSAPSASAPSGHGSQSAAASASGASSHSSAAGPFGHSSASSPSMPTVGSRGQGSQGSRSGHRAPSGSGAATRTPTPPPPMAPPRPSHPDYGEADQTLLLSETDLGDPLNTIASAAPIPSRGSLHKPAAASPASAASRHDVQSSTATAFGEAVRREDQRRRRATLWWVAVIALIGAGALVTWRLTREDPLAKGNGGTAVRNTPPALPVATAATGDAGKAAVPPISGAADGGRTDGGAPAGTKGPTDGGAALAPGTDGGRASSDARPDAGVGPGAAVVPDAGAPATKKSSKKKSKKKKKKKKKKPPKQEPTTGTLSLRTTPATDVYAGRKLLGRTPLEKVLPKGPITLRLRNRQLGIDVSLGARIRPGITNRLTRVLKKARLKVRVEPWARVTLDGRSLGETPIPAKSVYEGDHVLVLRNPRLKKTETIRVYLRAGQTKLIERVWMK